MLTDVYCESSKNKKEREREIENKKDREASGQ